LSNKQYSQEKNVFFPRATNVLSSKKLRGNTARTNHAASRSFNYQITELIQDKHSENMLASLGSARERRMKFWKKKREKEKEKRVFFLFSWNPTQQERERHEGWLRVGVNSNTHKKENTVECVEGCTINCNLLQCIDVCSNASNTQLSALKGVEWIAVCYNLSMCVQTLQIGTEETRNDESAFFRSVILTFFLSFYLRLYSGTAFFFFYLSVYVYIPGQLSFVRIFFLFFFFPFFMKPNAVISG